MGNAYRDALPAEVRRGRVGRPYRRLQKRVFAEESHCWRCWRYVDQTLAPNDNWARSLDHVIPLAQGGDPLARANARLAHRWCNSSKGARLTQPGTPRPARITSRRW